MISKFKHFLLALATALSLLVSAPANAALACHGTLFNPLLADWTNVFPITVFGVRLGPNILKDPPYMYEPAVCVCPSIFGIPLPGIGVTYWQPLYLAEIERTPGCLSTLGGVNVLPGFEMLGNHSNSSSDNQQTVNRMQVHQYEYPLFAMMDLFTSFTCTKFTGFSVGLLTEPLYNFQDDTWGVVFTPEAVLFADPVMQLAGPVDAVASEFSFPLDFLHWVAGSWGSVYPFTLNAPQANTDWSSNNLVLAKAIAWQARVGMMWTTIGPTAMCFPHPSPVWIKSQFRFNQVHPFYKVGKAVVTGASPVGTFPPVESYPTHESTAFLIWQGAQCCLKPLP